MDNDINKEIIETEGLTKEQTWDVVKFASNVYSIFNGYNTPQLANQTLMQLNNNASEIGRASCRERV